MADDFLDNLEVTDDALGEPPGCSTNRLLLDLDRQIRPFGSKTINEDPIIA